MRLATLALHLGFLVTSFVLGAASGRQQGVRAAASLDRVPVAGSIPETGAGVPSDEAAPPEESRALSEANGMPRPKSRPARREPTMSQIAARAQQWTVAVRADQNYGAGIIVDRAGLVLTN